MGVANTLAGQGIPGIPGIVVKLLSLFSWYLRVESMRCWLIEIDRHTNSFDTCKREVSAARVKSALQLNVG